MSDPLDDFNRRTTAGSGSWMMGPPRNAAESAAQSFIDARGRRGTAAGGGSIDFGVKTGAVMLLIGIALFLGGAYALENMQGGAAMLGVVVLIVSGFLILIGGGGLAIACLKELGSARGWLSLSLAALAGLAGWWFSPWLWSVFGLPVPQGLAALAAAGVVLAFTGRR